MGQIKNIKLHIVTDIKTPKWVHIQQSQKIQPSHAKHEVLTSECTSRTPEKQLKPSRRCTSGKPTDISKMFFLRNKSFHSDDSVVELAVKLKPKLMDALKEDGPSSLLSSCCNF